MNQSYCLEMFILRIHSVTTDLFSKIQQEIILLIHLLINKYPLYSCVLYLYLCPICTLRFIKYSCAIIRITPLKDTFQTGVSATMKTMQKIENL